MKPLPILKWLGVSVDCVFALSMIFFPIFGGDAFTRFAQILPFWITFITLLAGVCFGANRLKQAQELKKLQIENGTA